MKHGLVDTAAFVGGLVAVAGGIGWRDPLLALVVVGSVVMGVVVLARVTGGQRE